MTIVQPGKDGIAVAKSRSLFPASFSSMHSNFTKLYIIDGPLVIVEYANKFELHSLHCQSCFSTPHVCNTGPFQIDGIQAEIVDGYRTCNLRLLNEHTGGIEWWCLDIARLLSESIICGKSARCIEPFVSEQANWKPISRMEGANYIGEVSALQCEYHDALVYA
jgi:hypothetical protein